MPLEALRSIYEYQEALFRQTLAVRLHWLIIPAWTGAGGTQNAVCAWGTGLSAWGTPLHSSSILESKYWDGSIHRRTSWGWEAGWSVTTAMYSPSSKDSCSFSEVSQLQSLHLPFSHASQGSERTHEFLKLELSSTGPEEMTAKQMNSKQIPPWDRTKGKITARRSDCWELRAGWRILFLWDQVHGWSSEIRH